MLADFRHACRALARQPLFTALTVIVLAGGLALSIFTWSFLHTAMLKPLPFDEGERIVRLSAEPGGAGTLDAADLRAMRDRVTTLTDLGVYTRADLIVGAGESTRSIGAVASETNIFETTRTRPLLGRGFRPDDGRRGAEPVVVLGYRTWQVVFGGDSLIVGTVVLLSGRQTRIIGVMPAGYGFPVATDAWIPIDPALLDARIPGQSPVMVYSRLAPGVSAATASAELSTLLGQVRAARPAPVVPVIEPNRIEAQSFQMAQIGEDAPMILAVLNTLAALILLLACVNVTNLLLARANERVKETAVRLALGAPRGRLMLQITAESVILCVAGGLLAALFASWGLSAVNAWAQTHLEGNLAFWWVWGADRSVIVSAALFVTIAICVLGGGVALHASRIPIQAVLQDSNARAGGRGEGRVARALIILQVTTVSVLMFFGAVSGVLAYRVTKVNFGYDTHRMLSSGIDLPESRYPSTDGRTALLQQLHARLSEHAAIEGVVLQNALAGITDSTGQFELAGLNGLHDRPRAFVRSELGDLGTLGIGLREGRVFDGRDNAAGPRTALVSAAFAVRHWAHRSAVGEQVRLTGIGESSEWRTVVGVVGDVLMGNPLTRDRSAEAIWIPLAQTTQTGAEVRFRYRGTEAQGRAAWLETVNRLDPTLVPGGVQSFDEILAKTTMMAVSVAKLFGGCFAFALLLAVSGTYGLMARSIGRRTREIGIRRALGATDRAILRLLVGSGARQLGIGALIALPLTLAVGWGFSRYFPVSLGLSVTLAVSVAVFITLVIMLSTWFPTRRAVALQPREALWSE